MLADISKHTPGKLRKLASERGQTEPDMAAEMVAEYRTTIGIAAATGIAPYAIWRWLKRHGYEYEQRTQTWIKKDSPQ